MLRKLKLIYLTVQLYNVVADLAIKDSVVALATANDTDYYLMK